MRLRASLTWIALGRALALAASLFVPYAQAGAASPTQSFASLCAAPGVIVCNGFENSNSILGKTTRSSMGTVEPEIDTQFAASGKASLRFEVPSNTPSNSSGTYVESLGPGFGFNTRLYVSWKQRFSPEMLGGKMGGGGWKQLILYPRGPSCTSMQFVMQNVYSRDFPQMYTRCGKDQFQRILDDGDRLFQQGDFNCRRRDPTDCLRYRPDVWMTFYLEIGIGSPGEPDTVMRAYAAYADEPLARIIDIDDHTLYFSKHASERINQIQFTPYNTGKKVEHTHEPGRTWYDDVIVSSNPVFNP